MFVLPLLTKERLVLAILQLLTKIGLAVGLVAKTSMIFENFQHLTAVLAVMQL